MHRVHVHHLEWDREVAKALPMHEISHCHLTIWTIATAPKKHCLAFLFVHVNFFFILILSIFVAPEHCLTSDYPIHISAFNVWQLLSRSCQFCLAPRCPIQMSTTFDILFNLYQECNTYETLHWSKQLVNLPAHCCPRKGSARLNDDYYHTHHPCTKKIDIRGIGS